MGLYSPNDLEFALQRAADEPAARPAFYKLLVESTIYILGDTDCAGEGRFVVPTGSKLDIMNWQRQDGSKVIPFFTSVSALQRAIEEEQSYLALPARSFFEITQGASLVLNPKSPYGKEFFPEEISAMLAVGTNQIAESRVIEKETQVLLGQPKNYPSQMVNAIATLLAKHSNVKAAYLTLMNQPDASPAQSLVVGLDVDGRFDEVMRQVGSVAVDTRPEEFPVDLVRVQEGEPGLSAYFLNSTKPFYKRSLGTKIKSVLGLGRA